MIIAGLTADAKDVPGPFGVYELATTHKSIARSSAEAARIR